MQEFASVSASAGNPAALVDRLNEKAAEGWSVVAIVGGTVEVTAFLSREATIAAASTTPAAAVSEPGGWATSPASTTAATTAATTASEPAAASAATAQGAASSQMAASSVPAQWAADPTGRYELRYWDGIRWTEHVSRAGQQYTDPL